MPKSIRLCPVCLKASIEALLWVLGYEPETRQTTKHPRKYTIAPTPCCLCEMLRIEIRRGRIYTDGKPAVEAIRGYWADPESLDPEVLGRLIDKAGLSGMRPAWY